MSASLRKEIAEFKFNRKYISHLYGGNTQKTFPKPRDEMLELHGLDDWMFLSLDFNPHAPTKPGHSGLFFSEEGRATKTWDTVERTFVLVGSGKWLYMGQYKMEPGITLSTDLWKKQKPAVRPCSRCCGHGHGHVDANVPTTGAARLGGRHSDEAMGYCQRYPHLVQETAWRGLRANKGRLGGRTGSDREHSQSAHGGGRDWRV